MACAFGSAARASARSVGTSMLAGPAYAASQRPPDDFRVPLRPGTSGAARGEALTVGRLVAAPNLAVDPPVAERFFEGLVVGEVGRLLGSFLREYEPDPGRVGVVFCQPRSPRGGV